MKGLKAMSELLKKARALRVDSMVFLLEMFLWNLRRALTSGRGESFRCANETFGAF